MAAPHAKNQLRSSLRVVLLPLRLEGVVVDSLFSPWLILVPSVVVGAFLGVVFERTRGTAARRAAKFEADLVEARSELMRYREQTKHHFGKSAELLGRMATDYREFLDHFVTGAESLCGPNMKEINASGLDRRMLGTSAPAPVAGTGAAPVATAAPQTPPAAVRPAAFVPPVATNGAAASNAAAPAVALANSAPARPSTAAAPSVPTNGVTASAPAMPPPVREPLATEPFAEAK